MFDPENVERLIVSNEAPPEGVRPLEISGEFVSASDYDQLLAFYRAVPHSTGHIHCPKCDATKAAITSVEL